ncbi:substrate-binding domain-containing protein [Janibacter sp. G56]|uniref:substrate-binding domain-containing protein n=1 Tax=Janibacter sp. G56 TaxID=3418717 RepID=UPI003D048C04
MAGAHARKKGMSTGMKAAIAALALVVLLAILWGTGAFSKDASGDEALPGCDARELTVMATPEIADAVRQTLDKASASDPCTRFAVTEMSSHAAAKSISRGAGPDIWIPNSSSWIDAIDASSGRAWQEGTSLATSPIVLAGGEAQLAEVGNVPSWGDLINESKANLRMANPDIDAASRLAYQASRTGRPSNVGLDTGARLIVMSRFARPTTEQLLEDHVAKPTSSPVFPLSEQELAAFNAEHEDDALGMVVPQSGTLSLDYPWIASPELARDELDIADKGLKAFDTPAARSTLAKADLRAPGRTGGPKINGTEAPEYTELPAPTRDERKVALEQWDVLRTDMRMLTLIDVSGSMAWDGPTEGMSRMEILQGAAKQALTILPEGSKIGSWIFSTKRDGAKDHQELVPVRTLTDKVGSGTQRDKLRSVVDSLDERLKGDTGLYDSTWAAYQRMQADYDGTYVNSVVIMTDGENDDPAGGLTLKQLLTKLKDAYDPERPVRIVTIGMGEADPGALRRIADETGGSSHIAETPEDIERVFVTALLARHQG